MNINEKSLQEQAKDLVFTESEVTPEFKAACIAQEIKINVVSDSRYEEAIAMGFGEWLLKNYPRKNNG